MYSKTDRGTTKCRLCPQPNTPATSMRAAKPITKPTICRLESFSLNPKMPISAVSRIRDPEQSGKKTAVGSTPTIFKLMMCWVAMVTPHTSAKIRGFPFISKDTCSFFPVFVLRRSQDAFSTVLKMNVQNRNPIFSSG